MQRRLKFSDTFQKLDATDQLLVETSSLPDDVCARVANRLVEAAQGIRQASFRTVVGSLFLTWTVIGFILAMSNDDINLADVLTMLIIIIAICATTGHLTAEITRFLSSLRERSDLRAKLIRGEG